METASAASDSAHLSGNFTNIQVKVYRYSYDYEYLYKHEVALAEDEVGPVQKNK